MSPEDQEDLFTTNQLIDRIDQELGYVFDRVTITSWTRRDEDPLPLAYKGRPGQGHKYSWIEFLTWFERECDRQNRIRAPSDIDAVDYHEARTIDMRERAKRSIIETELQAGNLGEIARMQAVAEDLARQAVNQLVAISARVAPLLAVEDDATKIDEILQREIRNVSNQIARARPFDLDTAEEPAPSQ